MPCLGSPLSARTSLDGRTGSARTSLGLLLPDRVAAPLDGLTTPEQTRGHDVDHDLLPSGRRGTVGDVERAQLVADLEVLRRRATDHRLSVTAAILALGDLAPPGPISELLRALVLQANTLDLVTTRLSTTVLALHDVETDVRERLESLELEVFGDEGDTSPPDA